MALNDACRSDAAAAGKNFYQQSYRIKYSLNFQPCFAAIKRKHQKVVFKMYLRPGNGRVQILINPSSTTKGTAVIIPPTDLHWCTILQKHVNMPSPGKWNPHVPQIAASLILFKRSSSLLGCVFFFAKLISPLLFKLKEPLFFYHIFFMASKRLFCRFFKIQANLFSRIYRDGGR